MNMPNKPKRNWYRNILIQPIQRGLQYKTPLRFNRKPCLPFLWYRQVMNILFSYLYRNNFILHIYWLSQFSPWDISGSETKNKFNDNGKINCITPHRPQLYPLCIHGHFYLPEQLAGSRFKFNKKTVPSCA